MLLLLALALPGPARGIAGPDPPFASQRAGPVTVLHADGDRGFAGAVAGLAAAAHARVCADLGLRSDVEAAVLLLTRNSPERTREAWARRLPRWMAGAALPAERFIVIRLAPGQTPRALEPVLAHELTHLLVHAEFRLGDGWPLWFHEGLALREAGDEGLRDQVALSAATLFDRVIPFAQLADRFPAPEAAARLAYAQSASFVGFLETRLGPGRFGALLRHLRRQPFEEAFRAAYGMGPGAAEGLWRRWAGRRYAWLPALTSGATLWLLITLLFLAAAAVRRRRSRRMRERWEAEEREEGLED